MMPVLAGVIAVVAIVAVVLLLARGARLVRRDGARTRARPRFARRSRKVQAVSPAEREWMYGSGASREPADERPAVQTGEELEAGPETADDVEDAPAAGEGKRHTELAASAIVREAEERAAEIVAEAERKAGEILADAEAGRLRLEQEAARERASVVEERAKLSTFLSDVLDAVQRSGVQGANVLDLSELRELRGKATGRE